MSPVNYIICPGCDQKLWVIEEVAKKDDSTCPACGAYLWEERICERYQIKGDYEEQDPS